MRQYLERQADAIEQVLTGQGLMARVAGGSLSPRLIHYHLELPPGVRLSHLTSLLPEIARETKAEALRLSIDQETGLPTLELPRPDPVPVRLMPLARAVADAAPPCTATLGVDANGGPLMLRVDGPEVGTVLINGQAGSGKSDLLRGVALSLALHNGPETLRLLLIDLSGPARRGRKRGTWTDLETLPHLVGGVVRDHVEARLRLRWVARLIGARAEQRDEGMPIEGPNLVVLVDGIDAATAGHHGAEVEAAVREIIAEGNALGVHLVCAAGSPRGLERLHWGARIVGRCTSGEEARVATGMSGSGAEGLLGAGDFLAIIGGQVIRFQAAAVSREEAARAADTLRACAEEQMVEYGRAATRGQVGREAHRPAAQAGMLLSKQRKPLRSLKTGTSN